MNWRLEEGAGEAMYRVGYHDDGTPTGIPEADLQASLNTLKT